MTLSLMQEVHILLVKVRVHSKVLLESVLFAQTSYNKKWTSFFLWLLFVWNSNKNVPANKQIYGLQLDIPHITRYFFSFVFAIKNDVEFLRILSVNNTSNKNLYFGIKIYICQQLSWIIHGHSLSQKKNIRFKLNRSNTI